MYSIQKYVKSKMKEKGIKKSVFVKRAGYSNISRGCKRFDSFMKGESYPDIIMKNLAASLEVPEKELNEVIAKSKMEMQRDIERSRAKQNDIDRRNFSPCLYCHTERRIPSPIFVCAILGADRMKKIKLPKYFLILSDEERDAERRELIKETMMRYEGIIPSFGSILCFTERLSFDDEEDDRRVYNLNGDLIENPPSEFKKIYEGKATLEYRGRDITKFFNNYF
jgi:hypothetical protein